MHPAGMSLFDGQMARCTVYVETVILPEGDDDRPTDRPKTYNYRATYRLPGGRVWLSVVVCRVLLLA